jgi:hypothetical protein
MLCSQRHMHRPYPLKDCQSVSRSEYRLPPTEQSHCASESREDSKCSNVFPQQGILHRCNKKSSPARQSRCAEGGGYCIPGVKGVGVVVRDHVGLCVRKVAHARDRDAQNSLG